MSKTNVIPHSHRAQSISEKLNPTKRRRTKVPLNPIGFDPYTDIIGPGAPDMLTPLYLYLPSPPTHFYADHQ
jgi:hypothetical protein